MNTELIVWGILFALFIIIEAVTQMLTTIWFVPGALAAIIMSVCHVHIAIQIAVFLVISLVLLFFTRPVAVKYINDRKISTNIETIVGTEAIVIEAIDNMNGTGRVKINGLEWMARTKSNDELIETGARVKVTAVEGVKVIVSKEDK